MALQRHPHVSIIHLNLPLTLSAVISGPLNSLCCTLFQNVGRYRRSPSVLKPRERGLFQLRRFRLEERELNASPPRRVSMKKIGFLSFGHWTPSSQSQVRSASDALLQSIDLAVAAEELGADGGYFRVHHFGRQLGSPFPLLAA